MTAAAQPLIEVRGLSKNYGGVTAIEDLSFSVMPGMIKAVIGPNGAGKTTLFNMLTGVDRPSRGEILLDGKPIHDLPPHRRVEVGMARTFQNLQIFDRMSVIENVMVGRHVRGRGGMATALLRLPGARREEKDVLEASRAALDAVGLGNRADDPAAGLSFGERKLLEVARAMASEPRLLLLDEPAAGLAARDIARISDLILRLNGQGITVLLVEHNMRLVMGISGNILALNFGRKIAEGTGEEIRRDRGVIEAYFGSEDYDA
ncbi:MAG TPA: ABC transporter ATP-binding protein [Alphaproteobacteria bacterium]|jgi:branched-chain amino acid transport system ATP-binding protein|nr:ABC transporter ATP-binding protein [Alphaproteobacteria bacterium]